MNKSLWFYDKQKREGWKNGSNFIAGYRLSLCVCLGELAFIILFYFILLKMRLVSAEMQWFPCESCDREEEPSGLEAERHLLCTLWVPL